MIPLQAYHLLQIVKLLCTSSSTSPLPSSSTIIINRTPTPHPHHPHHHPITIPSPSRPHPAPLHAPPRQSCPVPPSSYPSSHCSCSTLPAKQPQPPPRYTSHPRAPHIKSRKLNFEALSKGDLFSSCPPPPPPPPVPTINAPSR